MKTKEELKEIREQNYDIWFKRFVKKEDLVKKIEVANEQGYKEWVIDANSYRDSRDNAVSEKRPTKGAKRDC